MNINVTLGDDSTIYCNVQLITPIVNIEMTGIKGETGSIPGAGIPVSSGAAWGTSLTATVESTFILSGPSPFAWAKKTLAQVKTILGLLLTQTANAIGFSLSGGTTSKTLTVEDTSVVNQDLTTDASPTFANITDSGLTASQMVCTDANKKLVSKAFEVPFGAEMFWPTETPPTGWLEENGASLSRSTYSNLFAVIGITYGAADETHFNLPTACGTFIRVWAHGFPSDPDRATRAAPTAPGATITAGDRVGTEQTDGFKSHSHSNNAGTINYGGGTLTSGAAIGLGPMTIGYTGGNETRPVNIYRMFIIKAY